MVYMAMELVAGTTLKLWCQESRSWRETVATVMAAGRGLAAAHDVGLIHLDFKPSNVIVGPKGGVWVLDFGLARPPRGDGTNSLDDPSSESEISEGGGVGRLDDPLTEAGVILGTPGYMPPEQLAGREIDDRADQFSFCVTLWEMLYGELPFQGNDRRALDRAILTGALRKPPSTRNVPAWVRRVLERGLTRRPEQRYQDMRALLAALANDPARWRRRVAAGLLGVGVLGLAGVGVRALVVEPDRCMSPMEHRQALWGDERREAVERAFASVGSPHADDAWTATSKLLERYVGQWSELRSSSCESRRSEEVTTELGELRDLCLARAGQEIDALVDVLVSADEKIIENAARAVQSLPPLTRCTDPVALAAGFEMPQTPAQREVQERLDADLARIHALEAAGRWPEALEAAEAAVALAEHRGGEGARALAYEGLAAVLQSLTRGEEAHAALERSVAAAERAGLDLVRAGALNNLIFVRGYLQGEVEQARLLASLARPLMDRIRDPYERARFLAHIALVECAHGRIEEALALSEEAIAVRRESKIPDDVNFGALIANMGSALYQAGKFQAALEYYTRSESILRENLGSEHPKVSIAVGNIAIALQAAGRLDEALEHHRRALAVSDAAGIEDGSVRANQLNNIAVVLYELGRHDEAYRAYEEALEAWVAVDDDNPAVGVIAVNLAELDRLAGRRSLSLSRCTEALDLLERALGAEHAYIGVAATCVGRDRVALGDREAGIEMLRRAVSVLEAVRADPLLLHEAQLHLGLALFESEDAAQRAEGQSMLPLAVSRVRDMGARGETVLAQVRERLPALTRSARRKVADRTGQ